MSNCVVENDFIFAFNSTLTKHLTFIIHILRQGFSLSWVALGKNGTYDTNTFFSLLMTDSIFILETSEIYLCQIVVRTIHRNNKSSKGLNFCETVSPTSTWKGVSTQIAVWSFESGNKIYQVRPCFLSVHLIKVNMPH